MDEEQWSAAISHATVLADVADVTPVTLFDLVTRSPPRPAAPWCPGPLRCVVPSLVPWYSI